MNKIEIFKRFLINSKNISQIYWNRSIICSYTYFIYNLWKED